MLEIRRLSYLVVSGFATPKMRVRSQLCLAQVLLPYGVGLNITNKIPYDVVLLFCLPA